MKPKHKLTPQVYKAIEKIASTLPKLQKISKLGNPLFRATSKPVSFDQLPGEEQKKFREQNPDGAHKKRYILHGKEPLLINHELMMIDAYEKEGEKGLANYIQWCLKKAEQPKQPDHEPAAETAE